MAKRLEGSEFVNPKFFEDFKKGAKESLNLINEIKTQLKSDIAANSKQLNLISPDSVKDIQEFNKQVAVSKAKIQELQSVQAKEVQVQKEVESASKKATAQRQKEQKQYERNRVAEDRLNKARIRAFDKYEKALKREQSALQKGASLYNKVQVKINSLTKTYNDIAVKKQLGLKLDKKEEIQLISLEKRLIKYQNVLKKTDANIGKHQRNVGNYKSAFDGLGFSINQLTREAPAFANSMQTGFMAISNNIPMAVDEIKKLIAGNKALQAQGKPTTSVLSKIGASIFSFQTALSLGVTLLTVYGAEIVEFIAGTDAAADSQKVLEEATKEGNEQLAKETVELNILFEALKKTNSGSKDRAKLIKEINSKYGTTLKNMENETAFANQLAVAYKEITTQLNNKITLQVVEKQLFKLKEQEFKVVQDLELANKRVAEAEKKHNEEKKKGIKTSNGRINAHSSEDLALKSLNIAKNASTEKEAELNEIREEGNKLLQDAADLQIKLTQIEKTKTTKSSVSKQIGDIEVNLGDSEQTIKKQREALEKVRIEATKKKKTEAEEESEFLQDILIKGQEKRDKEFDKQRKKERKETKDQSKVILGFAKERAKTLQNAAKTTTDFLIEQSNKRIRAIDREVDASKRKANTLKAIAVQGNLDAKESIAIEEKRQAKATQQKEKEIKKQKQIEASLAMLKTYTTALEKTGDSKKALAEVLKSGVLLSGLINALPSFYDGTEDTGNGGNLDVNGGFVAKLHKNERVVNAENNKHLKGIANAELPMAAAIYRQFKGGGTDTNKPNDALLSEVKKLNKNFEGLDIPSYSNEFDKVSGTIQEIVKHRNRTERTERRVFWE